MKKNTMMRIASVLLVCVLLSTCTISGTFAKYVTEGTGTDTARVAKFGVEVKAFDGMFSKTYTTHDADYIATYTNSVVSDGEDKVVAPGTDGKMTEIAITGTPEVAVEVTYAVTNIYLANWIDNEGKFYCPITINVCGTPLCGLDYESADKFAEAITNLVKGYKKSYGAGQPLVNVQDQNMDITWSWAFENKTGTHNNQTDVKDTFLGNWVLRGEDHKPVITLEVTCTVTQID